MQKPSIFNMGINDADYSVNPKPPEGKRPICPYYQTWKNMLRRAYSAACHKNQPTYKDVTVCNEWHTFSNFKTWMERQDWQGHHLDKDIIKPGNKIYAPEFCCFIPVTINTLFGGRGNSGYSKIYDGRYVARCCHAGKKTYHRIFRQRVRG